LSSFAVETCGFHLKDGEDDEEGGAGDDDGFDDNVDMHLFETHQ